MSWLTFAKTAGFAFSIALPPLLVRRMDREPFGLYKQAFLVVTTAMTVLPLGVPMSAFYFLPRETMRRRETIVNIVLFHVLAGALACVALILYPLLGAAILHGAAGILMIVQTDLHSYFVSNHFGPGLFAVYSLGTLQLPLMGLIQEASNSVLITRVTILQKCDEHRDIVLLIARAARKLAAVYFPVYVLLMVVGREFIRVLFTARFADTWPIFAVNLTLLPLGIVLLDPLYRAYQRERYFRLRLRLALAAVLILTLWFLTGRLGLLGVIAVVVLVAAFERAVMATHFCRVLGVTARDWILLRDVDKLAVAALAAGVITGLIRWLLAGQSALIVLAVCCPAFAVVYLGAVLRWLLVPLASRATSAAVSSR